MITWRGIMAKALVAVFVLAVSMCGSPKVAFGAELGSAKFSASPERPVGWRGDGMGKYPGATPPVNWGRTAKPEYQLRSQAAKPKEGETGAPIPDGVIREWLVLGPVPCTNTLNDNVDFLPNEAQLLPAEGDKVGDLAWKKVTTDTSSLDFKKLFCLDTRIPAVVYVYANVYSEIAQPINFRWMGGGRFLFNGRTKHWEGGSEKGWNRLLFRVPCGKVDIYGYDKIADWFFRLVIFPGQSAKYDEQNIAWKIQTPGWSCAQPVITGDRLFVTGELRTLACIDKKDGKILWVRTISFYDLATDEEKKANPEIFKEVEPLAERLKALDESFVSGAASTNIQAFEKARGEKREVEGKIAGLMYKVDREKYKKLNPGEGGLSAPTPTTDGRQIYAFFQGLMVCYDLQGNRKWAYLHPIVKDVEHGYISSPLVIGGKVIFRDEQTVALDAATGKLAWEMPRETWNGVYPDAGRRYVSGNGYFFISSLLGHKLGKELLLVTPLDVVRVRDGKVLTNMSAVGIGGIQTPVIHEGVVYRFSEGIAGGKKLDIIRLPSTPDEPFTIQPEKLIYIPSTNFPMWHAGCASASPLYHDGLIYSVSDDGVLSVTDTVKHELLYQKMLDADLYMRHSNDPGRGGFAASPTLAGKYIYLFGNRGTCLVIEPGREYKQVAKNLLSSCPEETTASCPTFDGARLYYRSSGYLYCIEENK